MFHPLISFFYLCFMLLQLEKKKWRSSSEYMIYLMYFKSHFACLYVFEIRVAECKRQKEKDTHTHLLIQSPNDSKGSISPEHMFPKGNSFTSKDTGAELIDVAHLMMINLWIYEWSIYHLKGNEEVNQSHLSEAFCLRARCYWDQNFFFFGEIPSKWDLNSASLLTQGVCVGLPIYLGDPCCCEGRSHFQPLFK